MAGNLTVGRRRRHRAQGSSLDASWIVDIDAPSSEESSRTDTPQASSFNSSVSDQKAIAEPQKFENGTKQDNSTNAERQTLEVPGVLRSPALSNSSGSLRPSSAGDDVSEELGVPSPARSVASAKAKKRRYASQHQAHWIEDAMTTQPHQSLHEADSELAPAPPQQNIAHSMRPTMQPPPATLAGMDTPASTSPSIFWLPHSPESGGHGYDAPPIVPTVKPNYSPYEGMTGTHPRP